MDTIKCLHSFLLLMTKFWLQILVVTCALAWRCIIMNAVLHIIVSLESEMRLGSTFWLPLLFVLYYLNLDGKFQRVHEDVNQCPTKAYADYRLLSTNFTTTIVFSLKIKVQIQSSLC